mmetsp:Transcript_4155/g.3483  ORF Transcript_4155/g.3483 Transcript_4155/m.3483 type:complete len:158 (+) Transcript_4155:17-490(+)
MSRKNNKRRYRREHQKVVMDYDKYVNKLKEKRERKQANREGMSLNDKVEERREQMQSTRRDRGGVKSTRPVIRSKVKQDQLTEKFTQMKLDRLSLMDKGDAAMESIIENADVEVDAEMPVKKFRSKKYSKAYKKMVKVSLQRAAKRPILIKKKMEID